MIIRIREKRECVVGGDLIIVIVVVGLGKLIGDRWRPHLGVDCGVEEFEFA